MHVRMYVCMYVCMYVRMYVSASVCVCVSVRVRVSVYVCVRMCVRMCVCACLTFLGLITYPTHETGANDTHFIRNISNYPSRRPTETPHYFVQNKKGGKQPRD